MTTNVVCRRLLDGIVSRLADECLFWSIVVADGWFPRDYEMNAFTMFGLIPCVLAVGFTSRENQGITYMYWWSKRWRANGRIANSVRLSRLDMTDGTDIPDMSTTWNMSDKTGPDMSGKNMGCVRKKAWYVRQRWNVPQKWGQICPIFHML